MKITDEFIKFLSDLEGRKHRVYKDVAGLPTIGVGHMLTKDELNSGKIRIGREYVKYENGLTDEQIYKLLRQDLEKFTETIDKFVLVQLKQNQAEALLSFVFNVGNNAFINSTLLKLLNQGKYDQVPDQMRRWVFSGGRKIAGLANRREKEIVWWHGIDTQYARESITNNSNMTSVTLEWLLRQSQVKVIAETKEGKKCFIVCNKETGEFMVIQND